MGHPGPEVGVCNSRLSTNLIREASKRAGIQAVSGRILVCSVFASFWMLIIAFYLFPFRKAGWDRAKRILSFVNHCGVYRAQSPVQLSWVLHPWWKERSWRGGSWTNFVQWSNVDGYNFLALFCTIACFTYTISKLSDHLAKEMFSWFFFFR